MTNPLAAAEFFALEAGECLDRLETLARRDDAPPAEDFLRASRVLRGSALMASQQAIARAAGGLESVARALRAYKVLFLSAAPRLISSFILGLRF